MAVLTQNRITARRLSLTVCLLLALLPAGLAAEVTAPEYQVKAAFLYNFAVLTEWPTNTFASADAPLTIGVLGEDPFGPVLEQTLQGRRVGAHPVRVARFARVEDVAGCQVLFISASEMERLPAVLTALAGRPVLTVGDGEDFAMQGGIIRLRKRADNTIGLRINADAAARAGLKLSSKLLALATVVREDPTWKGAR